MMKKVIQKGLLCAMLPPALIYNLVTHAVGVAWDGYWEVVDIIRNGGRG